MKVQKRRIRHTDSVDNIMEEIGGYSQDCDGYNPRGLIDYFYRWPIRCVRIACLNGLKRSFWNLDCLDWARETIEGLIEIGDISMAKEVMEVYADTVCSKTLSCIPNLYSNEDVPMRLSGFGPALWKEFVSLVSFAANTDKRLFGLGLKIICRCVDPEEFPGCFNHKDLACIHTSLVTALDGVAGGMYSEEQWHFAERALRIVVRAGDHSYIERIKKMVAAHEQDRALPNFRYNRLNWAANLAILRETLLILE